MKRDSAAEGLLVVDKPAGMTSHDVVSRVRRLARTRRVGHAGTLDPMATGVLLLGLGRATRLLGHLALTDKVYLATIRLGRTTSTDDAEGEPLTDAPADHLEQAAVEAAMTPLTGDILQVPSAVSAIKVAGRRAYDLVRAGEKVELAARPVRVSAFVPHRLRPAGTFLDLDVEVACSSGTYVRALARDLGAALGVGGHLTMLRRTAVGSFRAGDATPLEQLTAVSENWEAGGDPADPCRGLPVTPLAAVAAATFPCREVDEADAHRLVHGGWLPATGQGTGPIAAFGPGGAFLALLAEEGAHAKPIAVFATTPGQS